MFHTKIQPGSDFRAMPTGELALRAYLSAHHEGLGQAAVLLAGRRGARLVNAIRDGLGQPGPLTTRLRRRLLDLRGLLFLEHSDDWEEFAPVAMLEPDNPIVPELCLLADGLDDALRSAGIFPTPDFRAA
ncbi:hypothetical protein [Pelagivirga sediminicola]|nr:hypothetical protein [Pelagivirga sediminicola]